LSEKKGVIVRNQIK